MPRLVPALVRQMGAAYPELGRAETLIDRDAAAGGDPLQALLERGLHLLAEETGRLGEGETLPGAVAFRLYDTYGFPLDLTQDALREQGRAVDLAGFEAAMAEQRSRARAAWAGIGRGRDRTRLVRAQGKDRRHRIPRLRDRERRGRNPARSSSGGAPVEVAAAGSRGGGHPEPDAVLRAKAAARSAIPASSPGRTGCVIAVTDTQKKLGDLFVHLGHVEAGEARLGLPVRGRGGSSRAGARSAPITRRRICCMRRLRRQLGTACGAEGQPERARPAALRYQPPEADHGRGTGRGRGRGECAHPREQRGRRPG